MKKGKATKYRKYALTMRIVSLVLCLSLLCGGLSGCTMSQTEAKGDESDPVPLSGFEDVSDGNKLCAYEMQAELTDDYTFTCEEATRIRVLTTDGKQLAKGSDSAQASLTEGESYIIEVKTQEAQQKFSLTATAVNHEQRLPYENIFTVDAESLDTTGDPDVDPLTPATISYTKREGGTYIYANNPEMLAEEDIGQALLRNEGLTGDVEFTYEHSNYTGRSLFLGYQLLNTEDHDVYVTVTNIGMQVDGEWLGQQSWSDYYNYRFELPSDYFEGTNADTKYSEPWFIDYTPRVYQPTTYRIPAGEYIYVLGGTAPDAYNQTNVADTANQVIAAGKCSNGVVKFHVSGGSVTGTFYCYINPADVQAVPEEQGFVVDRNDTVYGWQYKGVDEHQGLIEANITWTVNDQTESGKLPVTYENSYDVLASRRTQPYAAYKSTTHTQEGTTWVTNINPQNGHRAVGTDMMSFACVTTDGEEVVIDNDHADGYGTTANTGNWMVDYHDNYTFVNQGDTARTFTIHKTVSGGLMIMALDKDGNVLESKTVNSLKSGVKDTDDVTKIYTVTVQPHSVEQVTISFLLMGNSTGNVNNWVVLD